MLKKKKTKTVGPQTTLDENASHSVSTWNIEKSIENPTAVSNCQSKAGQKFSVFLQREIEKVTHHYGKGLVCVFQLVVSLKEVHP